MDPYTKEIKDINRCNHNDSDWCTCDCHSNSFRVYHLIPCCTVCIGCNRQIKMTRMIAWSPKI